MSEEYMNDTMEEVTETNEVEVVESNPVATMPTEIYVPESNDTTSDGGPNKMLIAIGIGGGLLVGKKLVNKFVKPKLEKRKAAKEAAEEERIMKVLAKTGLVKTVEPADTKPAAEVEEPKQEVQEATATDETKKDEKTDKK